jgi:hypothetical protein
MALTEFCLHVLHMWGDDDVLLFTDETFKRSTGIATRLAESLPQRHSCHQNVRELQLGNDIPLYYGTHKAATVKAATCMSGDDDDVPVAKLFYGTQVINHHDVFLG